MAGRPVTRSDNPPEHLRQRSASRSAAGKELITEDLEGHAQGEAPREH